MRFLVTTLQFEESDGYLRVSDALRAAGHDVAHVAVSRLAVRAFRKAGFAADCLPERIAALGERDLDAEARRLESTYAMPSLRSVWLSDPACHRRPQAWCLERTVRHFLVLEQVFDEQRPDVVVPEVGSETMRTAAHLIALHRSIPTLFMFFTIFPNPLRLYVDTPHAPIVAQEDVRELSAPERAEVQDFIDGFIGRDRPILAHRRARVTPSKLHDFARHSAVSAFVERDNEYLQPWRFVTNLVAQRTRAHVARRLYRPLPERPFVYFPLHVTDDFKVKRVIPHCVDQAYIIEQIADALPQGYDVVLKEHPVSLGRNSLGFLRRLARGRENVRLIDPMTSSHDLIRRSRAVAVIGSTVGLEALLHGRAVLTTGQPFYSGYGVTVDVDSFRELRDAVVGVLDFEPDRERTLRLLHAAMRSTYPGAPASVDPSRENARLLASSLVTCASRTT